MRARFVSTLVNILPEISASQQKGVDWFIEFDRPLDATQTNRIREICSRLQNLSGGLVFAYEIFPFIPTEEKKPPARQCDTGGKVLRITVSRRGQCQMTLDSIAGQVVIALSECSKQA